MKFAKQTKFSLQTKSLLLAVTLGLSTCAIAPPSAYGAEDDVVARALKDEMKRSISRLHLDQYKGPYFGSYCLDQFNTHHVAASFGALNSNYRSRTRTLTVVMREGDYTLDSSGMGSGGALSALLGNVANGSSITCDDDYDAIRHEVWLKTDEAYKKAIEDLAAKKAYLVENNVKDLPESMSKEEPVVIVDEIALLRGEDKAVTDLVAHLSSIFRKYPQIQKSFVKLDEDAYTRWFVNSEGFSNRIPHNECRIVIAASGQSADGSVVADAQTFNALNSGELPSAAELDVQVNKLAERVTKLIAAPEIEEYHGPILFEGAAAASFFADILQPNLGYKPAPLSKFAGMDGQSANPFAEKLGTRVLPAFISVVDDPLSKKFGDTNILTSYFVDDDGVKAERITLVDKGILKTFAMSRAPSKTIKHSNGHGNGGTGNAQNVYISTDVKSTPAQLKERLIELGKEEGLKEVLIVRRLTNSISGALSPQSLLSSMLGMFGKSSEVKLSAPVELVRVSVADGHEELVRGGQFGNLTTRVLRDIEAAGDDAKAYRVSSAASGGFGSLVGGPEFTMVTPSVLVKEVELQKPSKQTDLLPILKNPYFEQK
jgi:predicted Zn-dependent protease